MPAVALHHPVAILLSLVAGASTLSAKATPKASLRDIFAGRKDGILACPSTKEPLQRQTTVLNGFSRTSYTAAAGVSAP